MPRLTLSMYLKIAQTQTVMMSYASSGGEHNHLLKNILTKSADRDCARSQRPGLPREEGKSQDAVYYQVTAKKMGLYVFERNLDTFTW